VEATLSLTMGASTSACPTRKLSPAESIAKRSTSKPLLIKVNKQDKQRKDKKLDLEQSVKLLPTRNWRDRLQETTLNPDAEPFHPKGISTQRGSLEPPPGLIVCGNSGSATEEPKWLQYLEKRLHAKSNLGPSSPPVQTAFALEPDGSFTRDGVAAIQTQTYLKLLKECPAPKRKTATANIAKRGANAAPNNRNPSSEKHVAQFELSKPMTTSSLAKKWLPGTNQVAMNADGTEERVENLTTRDDISLEKMLVDQDPSDPAVWSETESLDLRNASAHRIGRRPKGIARSYVMQELTYLLDRSVGMLLCRLQVYTDQQKTLATSPENPVAPRRFVIGLKEVVRRIKQSKVECLIVAPDIQEDANNGGLDDRMRELLALAYQSKIPVIFALSRARLGKALGKSLNISVLGVLDAIGARELFDESVQLANENRQAWLARLEK